MTDLPQPLTPADCNLRGLPFMPLMVTQVLQSETFGLSTGDEFKAAFALWCASWLEVPAGSLPNEDRMLEFLSRSRTWKKVRTIAMRGWVLCSDGRLYHPVIAQNAVDAWEKRTDYREKEGSKNERQQRWRDQCKHLAAQLRDLGVTPPKGASLEKLKTLLNEYGVDTLPSTNVDVSASTVDAGEIGKTETVKRQGQLTTNPKEQQPVSSTANTPTTAVGALCIAMRAVGVEVQPADPRMIALAEQGMLPETAAAACAEAKRSKPNERIKPGYVLAILERWAKDAAALNVAGAARPPQSGYQTPNEKAKAFADRLTGKNRNDQPADRIIDINAAPARKLG